MKNILISIGLIFLCILFVLSGCFNNFVEGSGKIQFNDFEGGFYGIVDDNGEKYDPINLPSDLELDGIHVDYTLKILDNQSSIHMWGVVVEIIEIRRL